MTETYLRSDEVDLVNDYIYSSVPQGLFRETSGQKSKIVTYLQSKPGYYFTAKDIAKNTGYSQVGTCVELRKAITELIELHGVPLVASHQGFAYANNTVQLGLYLDHLRQKQQGLHRRILAIEKIMEKLLDNKGAQ